LEIDGISASYTIRTGDTGESVLGELRGELQSAGLDADIELNLDGDGNLVVNTSATQEAFTVSLTASRGTGGLAGLEQVATSMVSADQATRDQALNDIEGMIDYAIDAAASFGSAQGRIQTQMDFVSSLSDALKTGIGALVDTNMEEASARLQALQVQQQLGVQSLSIANQAPQTILALFR
ncbi:MAG: flagellin, partial [Paracoccaceae bacterium]|nr:flagellin [Paracoccaceae bacterium]